MSCRASSKVMRPLVAAVILGAVLLPTAQAQSAGQGAAPAAAAPTAVAPAPPPAARSYPARARADFERAVAQLRAGNATEAELEFGQLAVAYPDYAGPQINIGLIRRKAGNLEASEQALRLATERNPGSALAWTELGVGLRMLGRFADARAAYERAIGADAAYAPAYRNLAVVLDLYLDDAVAALAAMEKYRELAPEDKPAAGWVAELKQRVARNAPPAAAPPPGGTP